MTNFKGAKLAHFFFSSRNAATAKFDNLEFADFPGIQRETHERFHFVPAFVAASAGVDVQESQRLVGHHFQDV